MRSGRIGQSARVPVAGLSGGAVFGQASGFRSAVRPADMNGGQTEKTGGRRALRFLQRQALLVPSSGTRVRTAVAEQGCPAR